ncbi:hypothetical protein ACLOJK_031640 [Asimina triloba]
MKLAKSEEERVTISGQVVLSLREADVSKTSLCNFNGKKEEMVMESQYWNVSDINSCSKQRRGKPCAREESGGKRQTRENFCARASKGRKGFSFSFWTESLFPVLNQHRPCGGRYCGCATTARPSVFFISSPQGLDASVTPRLA